MNQKQKKVLASLDVCELILSILGFITCCMIFALSRMNERYFFFAVALFLGMNIVHNIRVIESNKETTRVVKYSKKIVNAKNMKKVSY